MDSNILNIDGSFGEGGGAILRLSSGFSILYNRPIKINNIRANRPKQGLRLQHLLGLQTLSKLTNSRLSSCEVGTKELTFFPNYEIKNSIIVNVATAANIALLLQPIQIACLGLKTNKIDIILKGGGTFGKWAPSLNYLKHVTYPLFKNIGLNIDLEIIEHGFFPKGGAHIKCIISPPLNLKPINLTDLGTIDLIQGEIIITNQLKNQRNIAERIIQSIKKLIKRELNIETNIIHRWVNSLSPGVGLSLWAHSDTNAIISSGTFLGEKQLSSEKLGTLAATELIKYIKNEIPVDNYLSDQLIPLMGYIKNSSIKVNEITNHTKTNLELVKLFTNQEYKINKQNNSFIIEII